MPMHTSPNDRTVIALILLISAGAFAFLVWLIYVKTPPESYSDAVAGLPTLNAALNALSAACLVSGFIAIRTRKIRIHMTLMITAFTFSTLFLISYIVYHTFQGDTTFQGTGTIRTFYFAVLISHIACTLFSLPLILTTFFFALTKRFQRHRKLARITLPLWLYVSVTGVAIFFLLRVDA